MTLPIEAAREALIGQCLEMICLNATQIYLHFGLSVHLVVEGGYKLVGLGLNIEASRPDFLPQITTLFDREVTGVSLVPDGSVRIEFDTGMSIEAQHVESGFENFKVIAGKAEILVG